MRLINTRTLELHEFIDADSAPEYAILSHRWTAEEVSYKDWRKKRCRSDSQGYVKIGRCCDVAQSNGLAWLWVDTACIDKSSSSDLSESINSMFYWYEKAAECYAYLADVTAADPDEMMEQFRQSEWFTRGWTLQELIAPRKVVFFSASWAVIGLKCRKEKVVRMPLATISCPQSSQARSPASAASPWTSSSRQRRMYLYSVASTHDLDGATEAQPASKTWHTAC